MDFLLWLKSQPGRLSHQSLELFPMWGLDSGPWAVRLSSRSFAKMRLRSSNFDCAVSKAGLQDFSLATRRSDVQRQDRPDETVVSPTLPSYCSGDADVMDVSEATDGIVNQMPLFRSRVHLCCLVLICLTEQCVGDSEVVLSTETRQHEAV